MFKRYCPAVDKVVEAKDKKSWEKEVRRIMKEQDWGKHEEEESALHNEK